MILKILVFLISISIPLTFAKIEDDVKELQNRFNISDIPNIEEAKDVFKKKCVKESNEKAYDDALKAKDDFVDCVKNLIDVEKLKDEIEEAKPTGDLDVVFSKYCQKRVTFKSCLSVFGRALEPCLNEKEIENKNVILNVTDNLLNFICHKGGDRIALFIAEGGPECLQDKQEDIERCANKTLSKYVPKKTLSLNDIPDLVIKPEQCEDINKFQNCAVTELEKCDEPTPANIVESLMNFIKKVTPCGKKKT